MQQASIIHKKVLSHIPSASGVEVINNHIFIIGDDSPLLYILNKQGELIEEVSLFKAGQLIESRIPKNAKPDFEAMAVLEINGKKLVMIAGSGSLSPQRDVAYFIEPDRPYSTTWVSLKNIYDGLRQMPEVVGFNKLNIEGVTANEKYLYLLQRGNITGKNVVIRYDLETFYYYLVTPDGQPPLPTIYSYVLPQISGKQSGFSGACTIPGKEELLITASVEDTLNEIDDGAVLGSFAGVLQLEGAQEGKLSYVPVRENGEPFLGKIESVAIQEVLPDGTLQVVAVTDNDRGSSELLLINIIL